MFEGEGKKGEKEERGEKKKDQKNNSPCADLSVLQNNQITLNAVHAGRTEEHTHDSETHPENTYTVSC